MGLIKVVWVLLFTAIGLFSFGILIIHSCNYLNCTYAFFLVGVFKGVFIGSNFLITYLWLRSINKIIFYYLLVVILIFITSEIYLIYRVNELSMLSSVYWYIDIIKSLSSIIIGFFIVKIVFSRFKDMIIMSAIFVSIQLLILSVVSMAFDYLLINQLLLFLISILFSIIMNNIKNDR